MVTDLQLQEAGSGCDLLGCPPRAVVEWRCTRVLDRADEERWGGIELPPGQVVPPRESRRDTDQLGPVEVEDTPGLGLVSGRHVVAGQAADVVNAVQRRPDHVRLAGDPVLVPADDLQDRLDPRLGDRDRAGHVRRMRMRGRVVGRVHRVDPLRHLGDSLVEDVERPPSIAGASPVSTS